MATTVQTTIVRGKRKSIKYAARDRKCSKKDCFVPFTGNGTPICRLYELGQCKESGT